MHSPEILSGPDTAISPCWTGVGEGLGEGEGDGVGCVGEGLAVGEGVGVWDGAVDGAGLGVGDGEEITVGVGATCFSKEMQAVKNMKTSEKVRIMNNSLSIAIIRNLRINLNFTVLRKFEEAYCKMVLLMSTYAEKLSEGESVEPIVIILENRRCIFEYRFFRRSSDHGA